MLVYWFGLTWFIGVCWGGFGLDWIVVLWIVCFTYCFVILLLVLILFVGWMVFALICGFVVVLIVGLFGCVFWFYWFVIAYFFVLLIAWLFDWLVMFVVFLRVLRLGLWFIDCVCVTCFESGLFCVLFVVLIA